MPKPRVKRSIEIDTKNEPIAKKNIKLDLEQKVTLPDEVWLKIMSYIKTKDLYCNVALVCKHFHNLSEDGYALKFLEVTNISNNTDIISTDIVILCLKNRLVQPT